MGAKSLRGGSNEPPPGALRVKGSTLDDCRALNGSTNESLLNKNYKLDHSLCLKTF